MTLLPDAQDTRSVGRGILLMLGAILFFTWMDAIANRLTQTLDPLQVVWARYLGQVVATFIVLAPRLGAVFPTRRWRVQILRSVLLFGATFSFYTALSGLEIAEATAIFEVAPLMLTGLAVILLGEKVGLRRWLGVGAGLVGALIIIRPGTDVFTPYALFPLLAAFCYSAYAIVTRMVSAEESPWTSFLWSGLFGALVSSALVPWFWTAPGGVEIVLMLVIGGVGGVGQFLLILAFRAAPASVLAPFSYLGLALAALWGLLFFGEVPDGPTIAGALIIVGAGLYVWHRERQQGTA